MSYNHLLLLQMLKLARLPIIQPDVPVVIINPFDQVTSRGVSLGQGRGRGQGDGPTQVELSLEAGVDYVLHTEIEIKLSSSVVLRYEA